jgi:hypothetical protein
MTGTQPVTIGVANANFVTGFLTGVARVLEGRARPGCSPGGTQGIQTLSRWFYRR